MSKALTAAAMLAVLLGAGCASEEGIRCEDTLRYQGARSAPLVRVPDDLSVPDESAALSIPRPPEAPPEQALPPGSCLESPPDFFEDIQASAP